MLNDFERELWIRVRDHLTSAARVCDRFHDHYLSRIDLMSDSLEAEFGALPSPFRALAALHQAWGLTAGDGLPCYLLQFQPSLDELVGEGLHLIGNEPCFEALKACRATIEKYRHLDPQDWPQHIRDDFPEDAFFEPIRDCDRLIGEFIASFFRGRT
ncbi:MAG: hypothetical protein C4547_10355 [Phycisphaerales bacterium]|nr:MAG: hypothetical protein C4547_10355 [Phycisphaerales bacterium]